LITRHGRRWARIAYRNARKIYFSWMQETADPFDVLDTARRILPDGTGKPPSRDLTFSMVFHPQVVALTGLLASQEWERHAVSTGHVAWLVEQITDRNILIGYIPKERTDPLIQSVEQYFSLHRFIAFHRSRRIDDAFFPREVVAPPRAPWDTGAETRRSFVTPYLLY
jgi:hypothetical protein